MKGLRPRMVTQPISLRWIGLTPRFWIFLSVLALVGYGLGCYLHYRLASIWDLHLETSHSDAVAISKEFAAEMGLAVDDDWWALSSVEADDQLHRYYVSKRGSQAAGQVRRLIPELTIVTLLASTDGSQQLKTFLTPAGRIVGYRYKSPGEAESDGSLEEARLLAEEALSRQRAGLDSLQFKQPDPQVGTESTESGDTYTFSWKASPESLPELTIQFHAEVSGGRILREWVDLSLDPLYAARQLPASLEAKILLGALAAFIGLLVTLYCLVIYIRRVRQKEISHRRNLVVGALAAVTMALIVIVGQLESSLVTGETPLNNAILVLVAIVLLVVCSIFGGWVALLWGASEGQLRESFPGKLTSLDALTLGRLNSANVAIALLIGFCLGGLQTLLAGLSRAAWIGAGPVGFPLETQAILLYSRFPILIIISAALLLAVTVGTIHLLVPLNLSTRWFKSPRLRWGVAFLLSLIGYNWFALQIRPAGAGISLLIATAAFLLLAFYAFDLLTALTALAAGSVATGLSELTTVTGRFGFSAALMMIGFLGLAVLLARNGLRGRLYREDEVRPLFAQHLAQRLAMQAEVSAARQAQLRLAPQTLPAVEGLSYTALCQPGRTVGGDFYDFYAISPSRLAIFLAEGGGGGLSAAISIAYAKGLLMPLVQREQEAHAILTRVVDRLAIVTSPDSGLGFLFALVDSASSRLEYARFGSSPRMLAVNRQGEALELASGVNNDGIESGLWTPDPGDRAVLFTDGVAEMLETVEGVAVSTWLAGHLKDNQPGGAPQMQASFLERVDPIARRARRLGFEDDLSAIFVQFSGYEAAVREQAS